MATGFNLKQLTDNQKPETSSAGQNSSMGQPISQVRQSLTVPNPTQGDTSQAYKYDRLLRVALGEIETYSNNPRKKKSGEEREQIKESIRAVGVTHPFHVTQKPGSDKYSIFAGGNSRYELSKELFEETGDAKFSTVPVIFETYDPIKHSDVMILKSHIIENEMRSDVVFWDRAVSYENLANLMGIRNKSTREIASVFTSEGTSVHYETLNRLFFATSKLKELGSLCYALSGPKTLECRKLYYDFLKLLPNDESEFDVLWSKGLSSFSDEVLASSSEAIDNNSEPTLDVGALSKYMKRLVLERWPELTDSLAHPKQTKTSKAPSSGVDSNPNLRHSGNEVGVGVGASNLSPSPTKPHNTNQSHGISARQFLEELSFHDHIIRILKHVGLEETFRTCELTFQYYLELPTLTGDYSNEQYPIDKIHPEARDVWWFFVQMSGQLDTNQDGYESIDSESHFLKSFTDLGIWQEMKANDIGDPTPSVVQYWLMSCDDEVFVELLTDFFKFIREIKRGDLDE